MILLLTRPFAYLFISLSFSLIFSPFASWADTRECFLAQHHIKELTLKNGIKVCLKQTDYEKDAVVLQIFAMGGYAALATSDRPSGMLAADIAWESGLENKTADQLSFVLYQRSIEIETKIQMFDRHIEACSPTSHLSTCLKIIHLLFTQPKFEQGALKHVLANTRNYIQIKNLQEHKISREIFLKVHTQNGFLFNQLTLGDLDDVSLAKAEKFFKQCFSNPSEFTFILVGDFDTETVQPLLETYLGSIPNQQIKGPPNPPLPTFPEGIVQKEFRGSPYKKEILTRLTFPIPIKITDQTVHSLNSICYIIKNRIVQDLASSLPDKKRLEVSYEFPFFPQVDELWLIIQFSLPSDHEISSLTHQIIKSLGQLKTQGPSQEEINELIHFSSSIEEIEVKENAYVLSLLANYYRANWDIKSLYHPHSMTTEKENLINDLNRYLKLDQYSIISLYP